MLDDNLPTFFLKPSNVKHHREIFLSYHGSDPAPAYTVRHVDPASSSPAHKNCYAAAVFDAYNPDVLYGEVLARPGWTQPTLSQEEMRKHNGVPPPPQPILPCQFIIQLYNPDQQIPVELKEGKWGASDHYEFSMPISTFRTPSTSSLDRSQSDPGSLATTPKINFAWRKESKLGKDLTCFMTGRSTDDPKKKSSRKDPDIAIALWRSLRELTIYEPNLSRLEIEDPKGLEIVLLLSAIVIKDLYFGSKEHMKELFNITGVPAERKLSGGGRKLSNAKHTHSIIGVPNPLGTHPVQSSATPIQSSNGAQRHSLPKLQIAAVGSSLPPPIADPRAQWELDAETARLKAQAEAEAREERRRKFEQEKADEAAAKRLQKQAEEEEKQRRRKQAEIDKETERLRKKYGVVPIPPHQQTTTVSQRHSRSPYMPPIPQGNLTPPSQPPRPALGSNSLYVQSSASSSPRMMSGQNQSGSTLNLAGSSTGRPTKKKSFFGLRSVSDDATDRQRLSKKSSAMW